MSVFKCKMCGGALEIVENKSVATCEYCGTQQTLPKVDDEKKLPPFNRANNLRLKSEFDKAAGIYESIIAEFPEEAEAYWGLVLCKYGIEYVDDKDGRKIPTCHRTVPTSIMKDEDFQQACENADVLAKNIYRDEAKVIDGIQKKILEIAATEEPYDIFICYKETDEITGSRTEDSAIAQDIYTALTEKGYKVFYARNSLRKVAGMEYEPYIYAALSSAKIMLAIGTKYDYYDAVWVKNEWSRFISMIASNPTKVLIPCYKNIDAYDIPEEFSNMQALDMGDVTFFGSLTENIERIIDKTRNKAVKESVIVNTGSGATVDSLLKRAFMFLEDDDFNNADQYCEKVLDIDPECAKAYLGKLMVELKVKKEDALKDCANPFDGKNNYQKALRFADAKFKKELIGYIDHIKTRNENVRLEHEHQLEVARKDAILSEAKGKMTGDKIPDCESAIRLFKSISGWKDANEQILLCQTKIEEIKEKEEATRRWLEVARERAEEERLEQERQAVEIKYNDAIMEKQRVYLYRDGDQIERTLNKIIASFESLNGYKDSLQQISECQELKLSRIYDIAMDTKQTADKYADETIYGKAIMLFGKVKEYKDAEQQAAYCSQKFEETQKETIYKKALYYYGKTDVFSLETAISWFEKILGWKDSQTLCDDCRKKLVKAKAGEEKQNSLNEQEYNRALALLKRNDIVSIKKAIEVLDRIPNWKDSRKLSEICKRTLSSQKTTHSVCFANRTRQQAAPQSNGSQSVTNQRKSQGMCQHCGGTFKGLFSKKCVKCGKPKDY